MSRQWLTLMAILLVYIPVAIDATVLHVAAPTLSVALGSSGNELLWIIDIYSLVMAGMVLPMGALGDKIGFKRLLLLGSAIFGVASLCAALSPTALTLIASRALLAVGAAMMMPATILVVTPPSPEFRKLSAIVTSPTIVELLALCASSVVSGPKGSPSAASGSSRSRAR